MQRPAMRRLLYCVRASRCCYNWSKRQLRFPSLLLSYVWFCSPLTNLESLVLKASLFMILMIPSTRAVPWNAAFRRRHICIRLGSTGHAPPAALQMLPAQSHLNRIRRCRCRSRMARGHFPLARPDRETYARVAAARTADFQSLCDIRIASMIRS